MFWPYIWLCCRAVRSLLEAGDQFVQRAAGLHMDHAVSSLLLKITCLLGIVMLVPKVERISTQIWNTQFVKIPSIIACSEQSGFRAPNLETNPETCLLQQCHFHPFPTFKSSKSGTSKNSPKKSLGNPITSATSKGQRESPIHGDRNPLHDQRLQKLPPPFRIQKLPIVPDLNGILLTIQGDRVQTRDLRCVCHFLREMDRWRVGLMGKQKTTRKNTQISHKNLTLSKSH